MVNDEGKMKKKIIYTREFKNTHLISTNQFDIFDFFFRFGLFGCFLAKFSFNKYTKMSKIM